MFGAHPVIILHIPSISSNVHYGDNCGTVVDSFIFLRVGSYIIT